MFYEEAYERWIIEEREKRIGEQSSRRLTEEHGHAERLFLERVWWPAFGHFLYLYPEYEVRDFKDGRRYLDFAYIRSHLRIAIEIDGYGPHYQTLSKLQFSDGLLRQNNLIIDGWKVLRFSYEDTRDRPRNCQQQIQQLLGRWLSDEQSSSETACLEKEILRLAIRMDGCIRSKNVCNHLNIEVKYARKLLRGMVEKQWLTPKAGMERVHSYSLSTEGRNLNL